MATGPTEKLFDVISQITPEQFTRPVAGSYGSIRNTLVHVLSAAPFRRISMQFALRPSDTSSGLRKHPSRRFISRHPVLLIVLMVMAALLSAAIGGSIAGAA